MVAYRNRVMFSCRTMRERIRADIPARLMLTVGALLPYWRLLTFSVIYVTDDRFSSDIFNGELPGRVLAGSLLRQGQLPVWTSQLCSGIPLAGAPADPLGLVAFALLRPAAALDVLVIALLLIAAHGAYGLARRVGADRMGAVLAGIAFAGSGYIACQLKHLAIVSTVVWLPVGLVLLDRVFAGSEDGAAVRSTSARRAFFAATFGLVVAVQVLSGFPQAAYICALVYGSFAVFRAIGRRRALGALRSARLLAGVGIATLLGVAGGAVVLLPIAALGSISDRSGSMGYEWATQFAYWPRNLLTFVAPYVNGDISDNSYVGPSLFWEDYGYVGLATVVLALYGGLRERRRADEIFLIAMAFVAYLLVLGPFTPVFKFFYDLVPGMQVFRFPTRFLIVVELGIALLGGIGLTRLVADVRRRSAVASPVPRLVGLLICVATALDLFIHQPRQNPMVVARDWLATPVSVDVIRADGAQPRTFTPRHMDLHREAFQRAQGWRDLRPYFHLRDVLEPNTGGAYWKMPSANCYAGIAPRWHVDVWGDHSREAALIPSLARHDFERRVLLLDPALVTVLRTFGVSHVLSPHPQEGAALTFLRHEGGAYIYRVEGYARARFVRVGRVVGSHEEAAARLLARDFSPDLEILLHDAPESATDGDRASVGDIGADASRALVVSEDSRNVVVDVEAGEDGFLLLADTFYPGWTAVVDGTPAPVYRANISLRGVPVQKGHHTVTFMFQPPGVARGLQTSIAAIAVLTMVAVGAAYADRRARR